MRLFDSLQRSVRSAPERQRPDLDQSAHEDLLERLASWRNLLAIAALLHDIGHPIQSHGTEFLLDDPFCHIPQLDDMNSDSSLRVVDNSYVAKAQNKYRAYSDDIMAHRVAKQYSYYPSPFQEKLKELKSLLTLRMSPDCQKVCCQDAVYEGSPHERMSAFYILGDYTLRQNVTHLVHDYPSNQEKDRDQKEYPATADFSEADAVAADSLDFICRMITGSRYTNLSQLSNPATRLEYSLRNCVISILNGNIDADGLDYITRNSISAGYATNQVDHERICNALAVYLEGGMFYPAWRLNAQSVIQGYIDGRNFEPKWLYSHNKVVYQDMLFKELFLKAANYIWATELKGEDGPHGWGYVPLLATFLSSYVPQAVGPYSFYRSVDGDLEALFKQIALHIERARLASNSSDSARDKTDLGKLQDDFLTLYEERQSHNYKRALWKSFTEYKEEIDIIATELQSDFATINEYVLDLIREGLDTLSFSVEIYENLLPRPSYQREIIYSLPEAEMLDVKTQRPRIGAKSIIDGHIKHVFRDLLDLDVRVKIVSPHSKDFSGERILVDNRPKPLGKVLNIKPQVLADFPYLFFADDGKVSTSHLRRSFFAGLEAYCKERLNESCTIISSTPSPNIIRDVIHGDIELPDRFRQVVDTVEFQRLRHIRQLATADQVYPNATHSRFSHALGTYAVMSRIVTHFEKVCAMHGIPLFKTPDERDIILLAALLHDLGHGPYSHAFEAVGDGMTHEDWTAEIILDKGTQLNAVLREQFGKAAPERVAKCLKHEYDLLDDFSFTSLYPQLISSQIDADRLDYLLRDSYHTGVVFGKIDLEAIIGAMGVTSIDDQYRVTVDIRQMSAIETFLIGRLKMYETVYYSPFKLFTEGLLVRILERAKQLAQRDAEWHRMLLDASSAGDAVSALLLDTPLSTQAYLRLTDATLDALFASWEQSSDYILSMLTKTFLHRNPIIDTSPVFERIYGTELETPDGFSEFMSRVATILNDNRSTLADDTGRNIHSFAFIDFYRAQSIYAEATEESKRDTIWIQKANGVVEDVSKLSHIVQSSFSTVGLYYSETILRYELEHPAEGAVSRTPDQVEEILMQIRRLIREVHPRNMIEIEEKYGCTVDQLKAITKHLQTYKQETASQHGGFYLEVQGEATCFSETEHDDVYYDFPDDTLELANCAFRRRRMRCEPDQPSHYMFTLKSQSNAANFGQNDQFARNEFEYESDTSDLTLHVLEAFLPKFREILQNRDLSGDDLAHSLRPTLQVLNRRRKATIRRLLEDGTLSPFTAEISLDSVTYRSCSDSQDLNDYQLEVELKSEYLDRVLLKQFTTQLRRDLNLEKVLNSESTSKYVKGRRLLRRADHSQALDRSSHEHSVEL